MLLTFVLGAYSSAVFVVSQYVTANAEKVTQFVVLFLAFSFDPLRRFLEKKVDQLLFGERSQGRPGRTTLSSLALLFPWRGVQAFVAMGWPCLLGGLGIAVPAALLLWVIVRRGAPLSVGTLGATIGATAGLLGVTVLQFKCPLQEAPHLVVWHGGVLVVATVAGWAVAHLAHRRLLSRAAQ